MAAGQDKTGDDVADQQSLGAENSEKQISSGDDRKSSIEQPTSDIDTTLHHEKAIPDEYDDADNSQHSDDDDESEHHHDPRPEGPEGLNIGIMTDPELPARLSRAHSRTSSARSRPLTIVPRAKRRGLLARFTITPEVERPYDYSRKTKWTITAVVSLAAAGGPLGSNITYPALSEMATDLNSSETVVNLTVAFYMLAMAIFPLWWSSFSESLGRRTVYIISFALFVVFSALSAVSTNIGMLIAMRILGGGAAASVQAVGAGTIADLWEVHERGRAMNTFYLGPLLGPLLAPIFGGALTQGFGWQSTMWFLTAFGGVNWISIFFFLPETLSKRKTHVPPVTEADDLNRTNSLARMSTRQSVAVKTRRGAKLLRQALIDPLECITYLRFPPVAITVALSSVTFASLFIINISIQSAFAAPPYNFAIIIVGLLYIPSSLGYFLVSIIGGRWIDSIMAREAKKAGRYDDKGKLIYLPEDRLRENAWIAASMFPAAMIWFGWCTDKKVFWLAAIIPNFFFGMGTMLIFGAIATMLTEFLPKKSSSGVALNNFVRNIFSCIAVIVTEPLLNAMGVGWLCTMVALFAFIMGNCCIWVLTKNSAKWRITMDEKMKTLKYV